jgi:hypothetical protein
MPPRRTQRSRKLWLFQLKNPTLRSALISKSEPSTRQYATADTRSTTLRFDLEELSGIVFVELMEKQSPAMADPGDPCRMQFFLRQSFGPATAVRAVGPRSYAANIGFTKLSSPSASRNQLGL